MSLPHHLIWAAREPPPSLRRRGSAEVYAVVLTLDPRVLNESAALLRRSCKKFVKKDCRAEVDWPDPAADPPDALPVKSPSNFWNAALSFVSAVDGAPDGEPVPSGA